MACTWLSTQALWSFGFLKPSSKIKRTRGHCKGFKSHVSWLFLLVHLALNGDILPALLLEEYCFSPIWSIQELEWLEILPVRLPALIPLLAPVCAAPPPSWACWILKASLRFWARSSLLWISSTTRLGNQPLSPSWSLSPIIQPGLHKTKDSLRNTSKSLKWDIKWICAFTHHRLFSLGGSRHQPSQWRVHLVPGMSMTECTAPGESLKNRDSLSLYQHICMSWTVHNVGNDILFYLVGGH